MTTNLDDLSNDEIRIRLLEYGFANLPVTQTTRKVLIKKLKNAMETQKTKSRRETVAVIKSSDDEDIPETRKRERTPNRRATIAVTEKTKKAPASSSSSESIARSGSPVKSNSRRSSRATPAKEQKAVVSSSDNDIINEESDGDVVEVKTYTARRSKTPTMSKSETVRTSYKNTIETAPEPVVEKKKYVIEDIIEPKQTATRRKTYTTSSLTATTEHFELPPRVETPIKFGKSSLTTSYNPTSIYRFDKDNDEKDYKFNENDTPYLSNFAKRLSTLKAEPLDAGLPKTSYNDYNKPNDEYSTGGSYSNRYSQYKTTSYQTVAPAKRQAGVVHQMAKDFNSLDRKYSINKYVCIALIIMLAVGIYVILFS